MAFKKKQILKRAALSFVALGVVILLLAMITLLRLPLERLESYAPAKGPESEGMAKLAAIQAGAVVPYSLLQTYWLFGPAKMSLPRWLDENKEDVELKGEDLVFHRDLPVSAPLKNQCELHYCYQRRMRFSRIPAVFWKGLIGIEDSRFLDHKGVDLRSIARAVYEDIKAMSLVQGGSTITQQLVKNLYFSNDKSFKRKVQELFVSIYLEMRYPKENILEAYFNEVFWGSLDGIRIKGLYAASIFYFAKKPGELTSYEAAILISMLKGPAYYHPLRSAERLRARVEIVYARLKNLNLFYGGEEVVWQDERWGQWKKELRERTKSRRPTALWESLEGENGALTAFDEFVFIHQAKVLLGELKQKTKNEDLAIKAVIQDVKNPRLRPFYYYSKTQRSLERAIQEEKHQVGSLLKPILYGIYLRRGLDFQGKVSSGPLTLKLKATDWSPNEAAREFPEELTLEQALQRSLNRPVIRVAQEIGFKKIEDELLNYFPNLKTPLSEYPAQLLGALELSVAEVSETYQKFLKGACEDEEISQVVWALSDPTKTTLANQVNSELSALPFFGKTGTSNDGLDNLFISFDGRLLTVIWVGLEGSREEKRLPLYGSTTAFHLYQNFVLRRGTRFGELTCGP